MSELLQRIVDLVQNHDVRISAHGYDELVADNIAVRDLVSDVDKAELVREYPDYAKGPCVLVLQRDRDDQPVHVVWGIPKGAPTPAVLVTAYRPDPDIWESDFKTRKIR